MQHCKERNTSSWTSVCEKQGFSTSGNLKINESFMPQFCLPSSLWLLTHLCAIFPPGLICARQACFSLHRP